MVSKAEVLDIYAELYDEFGDAPGVIKALHKVCDKLKSLQPQEPVVSPTIGGWISVKDRLPEKYGHYLVIRDNGFMSVDTWTRHSHWGKAVCKITHWMPLPEPPKE